MMDVLFGSLRPSQLDSRSRIEYPAEVFAAEGTGPPSG